MLLDRVPTPGTKLTYIDHRLPSQSSFGMIAYTRGGQVQQYSFGVSEYLTRCC